MKLNCKFLRLLLAFVLVAANGFPALTHLAAAQPTSTQQATAAPALPKGFERVTSVEGITEYRLANGLRVLMFPDQTKQTITVNITYKVGSASENRSEERRVGKECRSWWG